MGLFGRLFDSVKDFIAPLFGGRNDDALDREDLDAIEDDGAPDMGYWAGENVPISDLEDEAGAELEDEALAGETVEGDNVGEYVIDTPEYVSPYDIDAQQIKQLRELYEPEPEPEHLSKPEPEPPQVPSMDGSIEEFLEAVEEQFDVYADDKADLMEAILEHLDYEPPKGEDWIAHGTFDSMNDLGKFLENQYTWEWHIAQRLKEGREGYEDDDYVYDAYIKYTSP